MSVMADRTVAALSLLIFAVAVAAGYVLGRWNGGKALDRAYDDGHEDGHKDGWDDAMSARRKEVPRPSREVTAAAASPLVGQAAEDRAGPGHAQDWRAQMAADLASDTLAQDAPRPPVHAAERSGSHEAYAQGPGCPDDVAWLERQLLADAVHIAAIASREAREMEAFHAHEAAVDDWIARWADDARASLVPSWTRAARMLEAV